MEKKATMMELEAKLDSLYRSPGGMEKTAAVMLQPLLRDLLHEGRIRQVLAMYQLGMGEEALFDSDVSVPAAALSMEGLPEQIEVKSERVRIDTTPIALKAFVRWNESNFRKFDILNRTQERAKAAIQTQEDKKGFDLIDYSSTLYHTAVSSTGSVLKLDAIAEAKSKMARARVRPEKLIINPILEKDLDMLSVSSTVGAGPLFLPETSEAIMKTGKIGTVLGLKVLSVPDGEGTVRRTSATAETITDITIIDPSTAYVVGPQNYVGVFAVRTDLTIETMKSVNDFADLFGIWEDVGFLVKYAKGICKISVTA